MRLTTMNMLRAIVAPAGVLLSLFVAAAPLTAQSAVPPGKGNSFKDTSMIKPPQGAPIAIFEFEDMECPACARTFPIVHQAVDHYKIPLVRHDYPLGPSHPWSFEAAVDARFLQDKVSPKAADEYRGAVFAAQINIANKEDLMNFTRRFFQSHGMQMPFVVDPSGQFAKEVREDRALGDKLGVSETPTLFVCSQTGWVQIMDPSLLFQTIEAVEAKISAAPVKKKVAAH
jgi:protein-disulfide isomerase